MAEAGSGGLPPDLVRALEAYRRREVSLGRASEIAGVPTTVFLDEERRAGILRDFDTEELRRDLEWAERARSPAPP